MKQNPSCDCCKNYIDFEIPDDIKESLSKGNLVIFAGGGISTEKAGLFPYSFYEGICDELGLDPKKIELSFPELMSEYENQTNGRKKLLVQIRERIEYVKSFHQLYNNATMFHKELAKIHQIKEIITTNWDDLFEKECDAIPVVIPEDFAYWDLEGRKVLKIHGSINNLGTIIADKNDYNKCYSALSRNTLGSFLKTILATKTVVFCGYSMRDDDFNRIYKFLQRELKSILPHAYIVTLDADIDVEREKITLIHTDAFYFLHKLSHYMIEENLIIDDIIYDNIHTLRSVVTRLHHEEMRKFDIKKNLNVLYSYSYQDGIIDSLNRAIIKRGTGHYLCPTYLKKQITFYNDLKRDKLKIKKYWDVAYIEGYINGLCLFLLPVKASFHIPLFYIYGLKKKMAAMPISLFKK